MPLIICFCSRQERFGRQLRGRFLAMDRNGEGIAGHFSGKYCRRDNGLLNRYLRNGIPQTQRPADENFRIIQPNSFSKNCEGFEFILTSIIPKAQDFSNIYGYHYSSQCTATLLLLLLLLLFRHWHTQFWRNAFKLNFSLPTTGIARKYKLETKTKPYIHPPITIIIYVYLYCILRHFSHIVISLNFYECRFPVYPFRDCSSPFFYIIWL